MIVDVNITNIKRGFDNFEVGDCFICDNDGEVYLKAREKNGCVAVNLSTADIFSPIAFNGENLTPIRLKVVNAN